MNGLLVTSIPHIAGLNPKNFRTLKQRRKELVNPSRAIIDGELVFKFTGKFIQEPIISKKLNFPAKKRFCIF
jgi:cleavage and polyadenylation specificity factor subunit 1